MPFSRRVEDVGNNGSSTQVPNSSVNKFAMPRRKPVSGKQHKAKLQAKRAIKRGDIEPVENVAKDQNRSRHSDSGSASTLQSRIATEGSSSKLTSRHLQSSFAKISREYLVVAKELASTLVLTRPIQTSRAILSEEHFGGYNNALACPKRPKWRYDMEKKEVEKNEEAIFKKWVIDTDAILEGWGHSNNEDVGDESNNPVIQPSAAMPHSPNYYERNIEVWRQLWRVTELSQILMILVDSRAPLIHFPPSLYAYITSLRPAKKLILVLTKVDVVGQERASAWVTYLENRYPGVPVVPTESYRQRESSKGKEQKRGKHFDPFIPGPFLQALVSALKVVHGELLTPPPRVAENPEKLKSWKPQVVPIVDWDLLLGDNTGFPSLESTISDNFLTIGLVGQPNVGKSSLLNALFGAHKVKASRTPGKTKHFQTLFWSSQVRLVDCPGLVFPNIVRLEMQVLAGILPISQIPSIPSCVYFASELMPVENILKLEHPSVAAAPVEDKRTWREERTEDTREVQVFPQWTAMDILTALAESKGWLTAKAGRPDVNRAGNAILRALAEAKVPWGFWPPGTSFSQTSDGRGIWLEDGNDLREEGSDLESEEEEEPDTPPFDGESEEEGSLEIEHLGSRFAVLQSKIDEGESSEEDEEDQYTNIA